MHYPESPKVTLQHGITKLEHERPREVDEEHNLKNHPLSGFEPRATHATIRCLTICAISTN